METQTVSPEKAKAQAMLGPAKILRISAKRTNIGIAVKLWGGSEIREIMKMLHDRSGSASPYLVHGIKVWRDIYPLEHQLRSLAIPPVPQLGAWILRHIKLGLENPLEFTLTHPGSEDALVPTVELIRDVAKTIYVEHKRVTTVKATVKDDGEPPPLRVFGLSEPDAYRHVMRILSDVRFYNSTYEYAYEALYGTASGMSLRDGDVDEMIRRER